MEHSQVMGLTCVFSALLTQLQACFCTSWIFFSFCSNPIKGITAGMNAGSQSAGVLILRCSSKLLVSVALFFLACLGTMSSLSLSLWLGFFLRLVDRHLYQLLLLEQSWRGFIWSLACLVAYTFNHTACERGFSSSDIVIHPLRLGSAVPAVGSLTEALKFFIPVQLKLVFSKADKWLVLGGMSPGNLKVGFIYDGSYAGDFYHQRFAQIHEINVSLFSLIGGVLLACACRHWKQCWLLLFVSDEAYWVLLLFIFFAKLLQRKRSRLFFLFSCV